MLGYELPELPCPDASFAGVVIRVTRVPPDAGVQVGENKTLLVLPRFSVGVVELDEVGTKIEHGGSFSLSRVPVVGWVRFTHPGDLLVLVRIGGGVMKVHHVVPSPLQLCLDEIPQQVDVAAVPIDDDDFFKAVSRNFITRCL